MFGFGIWVLDLEFWVLDFGFGVTKGLGMKLWVVFFIGSRHWVIAEDARLQSLCSDVPKRQK